MILASLPRMSRLLAPVMCGLTMLGQVSAGERQAAAGSPYKLVVPAFEFFRVSDLDQYKLVKTDRGPAAALARMPFAKEIEAAARSAELDPALLHALIHVESRHQAQALSAKGATGLMQVLPETAARFGVPNPERSVEANLKAGSLYLRSLMRQFDGRLDLTLAAYNAGEGAVLRHSMTIPPYAETQRYVPAVISKYDEWRAPVNPPVRIEYLSGTRLMPLR